MKRFHLFALPVAVIFLAVSGAMADGILRVPKQARVPADVYLTLTGSFVTTEIFDQVAITTIRNSFYNDLDSIAKCTYHFKLPSSASVTGFGVWRKSGLKLFDLKPGEQGGGGGGAGDNQDLLDYLGTNPFSAPLDSIPPGVFSVYLRYVELLGYDFGTMELTYPLFTGDFLKAPIDTVDIHVSLTSRRSIGSLKTPNYPDDSQTDQQDQNHGTVSMHLLKLTPQSDWNLTLKYQQMDIGAWLYAHRAAEDSTGYFMLVIEPGEVDTSEAVQKNFTFLLDVSGSMSGNKISQARTAILNCFDHLLLKDHFNIITFNQAVTKYSQTLLPATAQNVSAARDYVRNIAAGGNTNIYDALKGAVTQQMEEGLANQVIFATDGDPTVGITDRNTIVRDVTAANVAKARIFAFGIGLTSQESQAFLNNLTDQNGGHTVVFDPGEARVDSVITEFYRYFATPAMANPKLTLNANLRTDSLYPRELDDVAAGKQLYLFGRYHQSGTYDLKLEGRNARTDTTLVFKNMEFPAVETGNEFVPRMWAKSVIDYWLRWILINGERQDIIDMIIQLSLDYGILTPYTKYEEPPDAVSTPYIARYDVNRTDAGVELTWVPSDPANVIGYNIYRSFDPTAGMIKLNDRPLTFPAYLDRSAPVGQTVYYKIEALTADGKKVLSDLIVVGLQPSELTVNGIYPNPFNSRTRITFSLPVAGDVTMAIFDMSGRAVHTADLGKLNAGTHQVTLDAADYNLATGTYFLRLSSGESVKVSKVVLLR